MKILMVNGSPHENGCTYTALKEMAKVFEREGVEYEILQIGRKPVSGCIACNYCRSVKCRCSIDNDLVNIALEKAKDADAFVFGSPVHYAGLSGMMTGFLDRFFQCGEPVYKFKPAAGIVSCRRSGGTAALDQMNKYFTKSHMPVVTSQYWNCVHGNNPEEVVQDLEGMQTMRTLALNMIWLLRSIEAGRKAGVPLPEHEKRLGTNFIR